MKKKEQVSIFFFLLSFLLSPQLFSQVCGSDAPQSYESIPDGANPGHCFLKINWGSAMPKLECGSPGSPAAGSTVPANRKLTNLAVTINGNLITLYDKSGGNCTGAITDLAYGTDINSYITIYSSTDFCDAGSLSSVAVDGNQTGATAINCDMVNADTPTPVVLKNFDVKPTGGTIHLFWETSSEENTDFFNIERSWDGQRFHSLGKLPAAGFSYSNKSYQWEDQTNARFIYYRLKIVDLDGSKEYSPVVAVGQSSPSDEKFSLFPSPVSETLNISIDLERSGWLNVKVFNMAGQLLLQDSWNGEKGNNQKAVNLDGIPKQLLLVHIAGIDTNKTQKIWKQ